MLYSQPFKWKSFEHENTAVAIAGRWLTFLLTLRSNQSLLQERMKMICYKAAKEFLMRLNINRFECLYKKYSLLKKIKL